jgi:hypothetical protein
VIALNINIYCPKDGKNMNISSDILKREDCTDLEIKIANILEQHLFDLVKSSDQFVLTDSRIIHEETANDLFEVNPSKWEPRNK